MSEQERDSIKESIKFNTELIRLFTFIVVALATGISSLNLKETSDDGARYLILAGTLIFTIFVLLIVILILANKKRLKELKND